MQYKAAGDDLKECREIAVMGEMKLVLADYYLERFRLHKNEADLKEAERIIEETEYLRRRDELERLMNNA